MVSPQRMLSSYQWAQFVSELGGRMTTFATSMELAQQVEALPVASALALAFLLNNWQSAVFPLLGGRIGNASRRNMVVLTALILLAGQAVLLSVLHKETTALYTIGATSAITFALSQPAQDALMQDLARNSDQELHQARATSTALQHATGIIVPMFGSLVVFQAHEAGALYLMDAASFVPQIGVVAYVSLRFSHLPEKGNALMPPATLKEAASLLKTHADARKLLSWYFILAAAAGGGFVYQRVLPLSYGSLQLYPWITSVSAVGGVVASMTVKRMDRPLVSWARRGAVAALVLTVALGVFHWFPATLVFVFVETVAYCVFTLVATPLLYKVGPDRLRECIIGVVLAITMSGTIVGNVLIGVLFPLIGPQASLVLVGTNGLLALRILRLKRLA